MIGKFLAVWMTVAACALAQQSLGTVDAGTEEGNLLHQASNEEDAAKKLALLTDFAGKYAKSEKIGWVWSQIQQLHLKAGQFDKALEAGEKLAEKDPSDLECAHNNLKAAEGKKDPDVVKKWAGLTSQLAVKLAATPKPKEEDEVEAWKQRVDFAKQLNTYTEYSLFAAAVQAPDPRKRIELAEALRQRNPQSEYAKKMDPVEFKAYLQLNDRAGALTTAERVLATDQTDEDILVFAANANAEKKDAEKAIQYSNKAIELLNTKPKPEGVSDADWTNKKNGTSAVAYFLAGSTYFGQNKLKEAETALRAGLAPSEGNEQLKAQILFYLSLAVHKQGKLPEALQLSQQCAAIKSPFQAKAAENAKVLRAQGVTTGAPPAAKKQKKK
ncbi:MAG: hypothetical protein HY013_07925 [Candidatus Solibacter usitatus]|nr:hypothetical protein [Candidatus Solibacter usitatus]